MKAIFFLVKALVALVVIVVVVGLFLPSDWECERTIVVSSQPSEIQPLLADLRRWNDWSAWNTTVDPTMINTFSGAESGQGAIQEWTGDELGVGRLEITQASLEGLEYYLTFEGMPQKIYGSFAYAPSAAGTEITWKSWGAAGDMPWDKVMSQVFVPLIGGNLETGLAGIKGMTEGQPN
ncbi:MAG: hypothetical protein ACI9EF_000394 [Pseudohongiellaceae bacterium]|jgi:hypothetical protein